jgi:hypothetical protein
MDEPVSPPPPRRSRGRRILIWIGAILAVLILGFLFVAPPLIAGVIKSKLQAQLNERIDGTGTVGPVSFSWTGAATIRDLEIRDRNGATVASVKALKADVGVRALFSKYVIADVSIDSPRIEIRKTDGRLNLAAILKQQPASAPVPTGAPPAPAPPAPSALPKLDVRLTIRDAQLIIVGEKESTQFDVSGSYQLKHENGRLTLAGNTDVKDGSMTIDLDADVRDPSVASSPAAKVDVKIDRVPLDARMGPMLELLHPAFAKAGGSLDGTMDGTIALQHAGPLNAPEEEFLKKLNGRGRIEIRDCTFAGSEFLGKAMATLGMEKREIKLKPVEFKIVDGRIVYDNPWQWSISGSETTFTGSIGLDRTLDMVWNIPVSDEMSSKVKLSKGQTYEVPIKGTVTSPRLDWKGLVKEAAKDKLADVAKDKLGDLLGGKDEKKAEKLLEEADALHQGGKAGEAAEKYRKIKDDYRKTRVYKDNKDRIDPRSEEK